MFFDILLLLELFSRAASGKNKSLAFLQKKVYYLYCY